MSDMFQQKTISHLYGEIVWLLGQSPLHKYLHIADLEALVMPPVLLEQFRIYPGPNGAPGGLVLWAAVTDEIDQRLVGGQTRLAPHEWNSGANLWLMEMVAPFGGMDEILADAAGTIFAGNRFKYHKAGPNGVEVVTQDPSAAL